MRKLGRLPLAYSSEVMLLNLGYTLTISEDTLFAEMTSPERLNKVVDCSNLTDGKRQTE